MEGTESPVARNEDFRAGFLLGLGGGSAGVEGVCGSALRGVRRAEEVGVIGVAGEAGIEDAASDFGGPLAQADLAGKGPEGLVAVAVATWASLVFPDLLIVD